jgi:hypothetical protein
MADLASVWLKKLCSDAAMGEGGELGFASLWMKIE